MMKTGCVKVCLLLVAAASTIARAANSTPADLAPLFAHIWRIDSPTPYPNSGSIYVFLSNGTLFEGSCVETYRIATWKADPANPRTLIVTEDGSPAFAAAITELSQTKLRFEQNLLFAKERRDFSLTAVDKEFVCPDLPK